MSKDKKQSRNASRKIKTKYSTGKIIVIYIEEACKSDGVCERDKKYV